VRPWQHVLDALSGYLLVGERLLDGEDAVASAWNFGPSDEDTCAVAWIVEEMLRMWGAEGWDCRDGTQPHEAVLLKLDCAKARSQLGWQPRMRLGAALAKVVDWHKSVADGGDAREVSLRQLRDYEMLKTMEHKQWA
jgi:CDP-glucose 4,6-dehydratase